MLLVSQCYGLPDSKTLLLKTLHIYVMDYGEVELLLNWKLLEAAIHSTGGGNNH